MKPSFSFILSLLLFVSIESIVQVNANCWEYKNPLKPWEKTTSECGTQKPKNNLAGAGDIPASALASEEAFQITFTCGANDTVLCGKAKNAFIGAGKTIATLIKFNAPVTVNATFAPFCQFLGECSGNILGAASAARSIALLDDDNIARQYPQALAKQFLLDPPPNWGQFDILAFFNAEADLFFEGDQQIKPTQFDFQYIITHELIHGLGFASGWNNYFTEEPVALTPNPSFLEQITSLTQPVNYTGFEQTAFDKYMVNAKDQANPEIMSDLAVQISNFSPEGTPFPNVQNLLDTFSQSPAFAISQRLIQDSQTPKTFAFRPQNAKTTDDLIFLETNLVPFVQGSSISHMNAKFFTGTPDFLEVFNAVRGKSIDQILTAVGGKFPIGPKLQSVLETLGYTTDNNPTPYKPKLANAPKFNTPAPQAPLPAGSANANTSMDKSKFNQTSIATSLTSSFNILTLIIVVAVTLLF